MAGDWSHEERVQWSRRLKGFHDRLQLTRLCNIYQSDQTAMARQGYVEWLPMPIIMQSYSGLDQSANFKSQTEMIVPVTIDTIKSVPWPMDSQELMDAVRNDRLGAAASQRLASDINIALMRELVNKASIVVTKTGAATGFDDIALADSAMNELGIQQEDRKMALNSRDYNNMASNLAGRGTVAGKVERAYERGLIGMLAGFETYKLDYGIRLAAAAGSSVTVNGANQYYTPIAKRAAATGETSNIDNRYQNLTITVGSGTVAVGDCFKIASVNSLHHITKEDTGQPKTFRITAIVSGAGGSGVVQITPPIISAGGGTTAENQYKNVSATPANGAAITFLNTQSAVANPFWLKDAITFLPSELAVPRDAGASVLRGTVRDEESVPGVTMTFQKQFKVEASKTLFRMDVFFGKAVLNTEMCGIFLTAQT